MNFRQTKNQYLQRIAVVLFSLPASLAADDHATVVRLTPALLSSGEQSLQHLIEFPDWRGDAEISILCGARLSAEGEFLDNYCWGFDNRKYYYIEKIDGIIKQARAIPARLNEQPKSVWIQYSVEFRKIGDATGINVYPNWGFNRKAYGRFYISPQLYDAPKRSMYCHRDMSFTVTMNIDVRGRIHDPEVVSGDANEKCMKTLQNFAATAKYIPAIHQGHPVAVKYVDFWFRSADRWTGRGK
jgi:hypothetical protein